MAGEITSRVGGAGSSFGFGSGGSARLRENHPFAQGHCSPCDSMFAELNTARGSIQASIPRPVGASDQAREPSEERREPGAPRSGDLVKLSAQGTVEKIDPNETPAPEGQKRETYGELKPKGPPGALRSQGKAAQKPDDGQRELTEEQLRQIEQLKSRDIEVRAHEQAHKAVAGAHGGAISLSYETGPDGRRYAVAGEVPVDLSPVSGDPAATVRKMQTIRQAALAPADPSGADRAVAARASQLAQKAQAELAEVTAQKLEAATAGSQAPEEPAVDAVSEGDEGQPAPQETSGPPPPPPGGVEGGSPPPPPPPGGIEGGSPPPPPPGAAEGAPPPGAGERGPPPGPPPGAGERAPPPRGTGDGPEPPPPPPPPRPEVASQSPVAPTFVSLNAYA